MSKANRLKEMKRLGFNIPNFVVLNNCNDIDALKTLSGNGFYSVRSSANAEDGINHSFAGVFHTFLNVPYNELNIYINKCFDYKHENFKEYIEYFNMNSSKIVMNVIVQEMIDSDISGVAFTHNPITGKENLTIEAVYGLGIGLVEGRYKPDIINIQSNHLIYDVTFQDEMLKCNKNEQGIVKKNVPLLYQSMHKLSENKILKIVRLINQLQFYYAFPFEIEWSFFKGKLYLLQLRPITTINRGGK